MACVEPRRGTGMFPAIAAALLEQAVQVILERWQVKPGFAQIAKAVQVFGQQQFLQDGFVGMVEAFQNIFHAEEEFAGKPCVIFLLLALRGKIFGDLEDFDPPLCIQRVFPGHGPLQGQTGGFPDAHGNGIAAGGFLGDVVQQAVGILQNAGERRAEMDEFDGTGKRGVDGFSLRAMGAEGVSVGGLQGCSCGQGVRKGEQGQHVIPTGVDEKAVVLTH